MKQIEFSKHYNWQITSFPKQFSIKSHQNKSKFSKTMLVVFSNIQMQEPWTKNRYKQNYAVMPKNLWIVVKGSFLILILIFLEPFAK